MISDILLKRLKNVITRYYFHFIQMPVDSILFYSMSQLTERMELKY